MKTLVQQVLLVLIALLVILSFSFYINIDFYNKMIMEDGIIEYGTAFLLLIASILFVVKVIRLKSDRTMLWIVFNLFLALGLFFGFGEEISWGQRIFSVNSGDFFASNNLQGETNLHNLELNGVRLNKWIFSYGLSLVFGIYFLVLPFIYKTQATIKMLIDKFGIPVPRVKQAIIFLVGSGLIFIIPSSKKWEIWECLFALTFLLIILNPFNSDESVV